MNQRFVFLVGTGWRKSLLSLLDLKQKKLHPKKTNWESFARKASGTGTITSTAQQLRAKLERPTYQDLAKKIGKEIKQEIKNLKEERHRQDMEIAPLRSLDDFVTGQSRFQIPDFANVERWFNRIVSNLLYYQTNYFLSAAIIFIMVTFFHPQEMMFGLIIVVSISLITNSTYD